MTKICDSNSATEILWLPSYLWDSSDTSDICDSCDSSDDSDSSDTSDSCDNKYCDYIFVNKIGD